MWMFEIFNQKCMLTILLHQSYKLKSFKIRTEAIHPHQAPVWRPSSWMTDAWGEAHRSIDNNSGRKQIGRCDDHPKCDWCDDHPKISQLTSLSNKYQFYQPNIPNQSINRIFPNAIETSAKDRSNRPGRSKAGSRVSARLVAIMT